MPLLESLRAAGIADPAELLRELAASWSGPVPAEVAAAVAEAADPELALAGLQRLRDVAPDRLAAIAAEPALAARLARLVGASPLVARLLVADPSVWRTLLERDLAVAAPVVVAAPTVDRLASLDELARALRAWKRRRILTIAARDLLGVASLEETMASLSALAEHALDAAIAVARRRLASEFGDVVADGEPVPFVVLGMGKLGGGELNFSSDIDLVYLYGSDGGESGGGARGRVGAREFFTRLAEQVTRAVHQATAEGFVFRVDLRLRPEGANGPIVNSTANALVYYESWGQTWERAA